MPFAQVGRRAELGLAAERLLETKEAGVYLPGIAARSRRSLKYRMQKLLATWLTTAPAATPAPDPT